jgi:hypothetical protein
MLRFGTRQIQGARLDQAGVEKGRREATWQLQVLELLQAELRSRTRPVCHKGSATATTRCMRYFAASDVFVGSVPRDSGRSAQLMAVGTTAPAVNAVR